MKPAKYVILNPSGNLTALVTEWGGAGDEAEITRRLMRESEQVAYLEAPELPGAIARIRLMGGEFCGNAAMAAAGWLIRDRIRERTERTVPLEVSGAGNLVFCRIRGNPEGYEGTVDMPAVLSIGTPEEAGIPGMTGEKMTAVRMEGILHLIRESREPLRRERAEELLQSIAAQVPDDAVGLMDRNPETGEVRPLVYVRGSGTMVWETACGSGSAAIGALEAYRRGNGTTETAVILPGGTIRAAARAENGRIPEVTITGQVRTGPETTERRLGP